MTWRGGCVPTRQDADGEEDARDAADALARGGVSGGALRVQHAGLGAEDVALAAVQGRVTYLGLVFRWH